MSILTQTRIESQKSYFVDTKIAEKFSIDGITFLTINAHIQKKGPMFVNF